jgi:hypothetical protein
MTDLTAEQLEEVENPVGRVREDFTAPNTDGDDAYRRTRPSFTIGDPYDYAKRLELVANKDGHYVLPIGDSTDTLFLMYIEMRDGLRNITQQLELMNMKMEEITGGELTLADIETKE